MVRHIVLWNWKDGLSATEKETAAKKIKDEVETLAGKLDDVQYIKVITEPLPGSSADLLVSSLFDTEAALAAYLAHPDHKHTKEFIVSVTKERRSFDYLQ